MAALRAFHGLSPERPQVLFPDRCEPGPTRILKVARSGMGTELELAILPGKQSHMMRPLMQANAWLVRGGDTSSALFPLFDDLRIQEPV